ncbi:SDR family oxidoreductase [Streptomyces massasporeus]|uniref:SDR family oxidoreductase n=1 Tax=Streptomyces massasporeus TaxID=67324 RepID=UPI0036F6A6C3
MRGRLSERVAIVTGGAGGIGSAVGRALAAEGASVVIADIRDAEGTDLAAGLSGRSRFQHLDVTGEDDWQRAVTATERDLGPVPPDRVRVCTVHPGAIRTPMTAGFGDAYTAGQPIPRFGEPEEVARLVLFIVTDATFSTGCEFIVDGGILAGAPAVLTPEDD